MTTISEKWTSNKPRSRSAKRVEIETLATGASRPAALSPEGEVSISFGRHDAEGWNLSITARMTPAEARDLGRRLLAHAEWAEIEPAWDEALAEEKRRREEFFMLAAWDEALRENATMPRGTLATEPNKSWAPEVIADDSGKFYGNALRFATKEEAEANVRDLSWRWMLVRETRVVESTDPVNYQWDVERGLVSAKKEEV